ncbi:zinc finger protein 26-like [Ochlerotatus camptorhynchus]|uniref:zinc finger protein 26-like n=1 Tax=Ochlerotatus camptorhynchus TaxID=644619 RepID=UPI0031DA4DEA
MQDSDDLELQVNADEMCRTCLGQFPLNQLKPIFCNEILDGKIVPFPQVYETTLGIKPVKNDVFPKNVCVNCKTRLKELFSFKEKTSKSFDLLYEIFGIEKPPPPLSPLLAKVMTTAGTQTTEIVIREKDVNLYRRFLTIERTSKPPTNDSACQVEPVLEDSSSQTEPILKLIKNASVQVDQPTEPAEYSNVELDVSYNEELLEETEIGDDNEDESYTHMDVIDDIEEVDIVAIQEENIEDTEITEITDQEELNVDDKASKSKSNGPIKLEPLSDLDLENEAIEYLAYEIDNEPEAETESESYKVSSKKAVFAKKEKECTYCQFITNLGAAFDEHNAIHQQTLESIFDRADYFRCTMCKLVYATSIGLENHLNSRTCTPINPRNFVESNEMLKHEQFYNNGLDICVPKMISFHMNEDSQVVCSACSLAFETLSGAVDHFSFTHQQEEMNNDMNETWEENGYNQIHACGICNEQFSDASFIRQHVYFHRPRHECPFDCKESFKDFYKLTVHLNRNHLTATVTTSSSEKKEALQSDIVCQICFKRFTSKASFKVHSKNHFADRRYTCTMCPKAFLQKSDLTIHIRSHTDERPFTCIIPGCDKKFRTSSHRRDHMSTHVEEKKYQCHICQKYFKAERILQGHIRLHSGFKPFECAECGKTFSRKHHVKLHMKTHGKDVNFT